MQESRIWSFLEKRRSYFFYSLLIYVTFMTESNQRSRWRINSLALLIIFLFSSHSDSIRPRTPLSSQFLGVFSETSYTFYYWFLDSVVFYITWPLCPHSCLEKYKLFENVGITEIPKFLYDFDLLSRLKSCTKDVSIFYSWVTRNLDREVSKYWKK
jgi:hypothetical protein